MKNYLKNTALASILLMNFAAAANGDQAQPVTESDKIITINDTMKWSKRMALSILKRHPEAYQIDEQKSPKWDYVHGLVLTSLEKLYLKTGDQQYYDYIKNYADALIDDKGNIKTYQFDDYNIDMITAEEYYLICIQLPKR